MFRLLNKREQCNLCRCTIGKYIFDVKCVCLNCIRQKSYYQVLGLDSTASSKDIKSAYYNLSLQFHPDKNDGCPESVAKFREITEAYEVLGNPEKKRSYDQRGDFRSPYSRYQTQDGYYYKPYTRQRYTKPFTGRSKHFDYDEHFRQHYENEKQRQEEYEYFKHRWDAEFRNRRNTNHEENFRNRYKYTDRENLYEEYSKDYLARRRRTFYILIPVWSFIFMIMFFSDYDNPDKKSKRHGPKYPIYYKIRNDNDEVQNGE